MSFKTEMKNGMNTLTTLLKNYMDQERLLLQLLFGVQLPQQPTKNNAATVNEAADNTIA